MQQKVINKDDFKSNLIQLRIIRARNHKTTRKITKDHPTK